MPDDQPERVHFLLSLPGLPEVVVRIEAGRLIARRSDTGDALDLGPLDDTIDGLVQLDRVLQWLAKGRKARE